MGVLCIMWLLYHIIIKYYCSGLGVWGSPSGRSFERYKGSDNKSVIEIIVVDNIIVIFVMSLRQAFYA